jgi:hypothetical protein
VSIGINYQNPPYADPSSRPMPGIGSSIVNLDTLTADVRGTVTASNGNVSPRTVTVDAVIKDPVAGRSWTYSTSV